MRPWGGATAATRPRERSSVVCVPMAALSVCTSAKATLFGAVGATKAMEFVAAFAASMCQSSFGGRRLGPDGRSPPHTAHRREPSVSWSPPSRRCSSCSGGCHDGVAGIGCQCVGMSGCTTTCRKTCGQKIQQIQICSRLFSVSMSIIRMLRIIAITTTATIITISTIKNNNNNNKINYTNTNNHDIKNEPGHQC